MDAIEFATKFPAYCRACDGSGVHTVKEEGFAIIEPCECLLEDKCPQCAEAIAGLTCGCGWKFGSSEGMPQPEETEIDPAPGPWPVETEPESYPF